MHGGISRWVNLSRWIDHYRNWHLYRCCVHSWIYRSAWLGLQRARSHHARESDHSHSDIDNHFVLVWDEQRERYDGLHLPVILAMKLTLFTIFLACTLLPSAVAQAAPHSATLTWTDTQNPTATTYSIYRSTGLCSGSPVFSKIASAVTVKSYADATVQPGNYCFAVTATFGGVESAQSNAAGAAVPTFAPAGLVVLTAGALIPIPYESAPMPAELG